MIATDKQNDRAAELLSGDWDCDGTVTVYLPNLQAENVAHKLGFDWQGGDNGGYYVRQSDGAVFYSLDELLAFALTALGC